MLGKAIAIASHAFRDKKDKGGHPYILHCLRVWQGVRNEDEDVQCAAVLHDIVEDCEEWTFELLSKEGFSIKTINTLYYLTHAKDVSYEDYIKKIAFNEDATKIKLADLKDNSDITRIKGLTKKDFDRLEKYHKSFVYLSKI